MPVKRDEVLQKLWHGKDPYRSGAVASEATKLREWTDEPVSFRQDIELLRPSIIVDVGTWDGVTAIAMASLLRELSIDGTIIAIDTWLGSCDHWLETDCFDDLRLFSPGQGLFSSFLRNVIDAGLENYVVPLSLDSINAAYVLKRTKIYPDIVYVDAGHDYAAVSAHLAQWWPLIKPGGVLIGGNYRESSNWPSVKRAFDDYFRPLGLLPIASINDKCRVSKHAGDPSGNDFLLRLRQISSKASAWRETCRLQFTSIRDDEVSTNCERLRRYIEFSGPDWDNGVAIKNRIAAELSSDTKTLHRHDIFGDDGEVRIAVVRAIVPDFDANYLQAAPISTWDRIELLAEIENARAPFALPHPLNINMGKTKSPPLAVYCRTGADFFLSPIGYQLFDEELGIYWAASSTRAYSRNCMSFPSLIVNQCVVIIQDVYEGSNYSHFLFDWITRLGIFLERGLLDLSSCLFVMGGLPSEFHFHLIEALCDIYALDEKQFFFPAEPQIWRITGLVYFFSDNREAVMHPAHMMHVRSVAVMRRVCSRVATPTGDISRIYISRSDTTLRQVSNENELLDALEPFGFTAICLSTMPFLEQVKLIRGAQIIIAPHGMGLTHIAFHEGQPLLIELHNPTIGTDAYAFVARGLNFGYRAIIGTDIGHEARHYTIPVHEVVEALRQELGVRSSVPRQDRLFRFQTTFYGGVQSIPAAKLLIVDPIDQETQVIIDSVDREADVWKHIRADPNVQPDNNGGWVEVRELVIGCVYHGSCDILLPVDFNGTSLILECSAMVPRSTGAADLTKRGEWQTIRVYGAVGGSRADVVLRCECEAGSIYYSKGWRFGPGRDSNSKASRLSL